MSTFSTVTELRRFWRTFGTVAGWACGVLAAACLAASVVFGSAYAAVRLGGTNPPNSADIWMSAGALLLLSALLGFAARTLFVAAEGDPERTAPDARFL